MPQGPLDTNTEARWRVQAPMLRRAALPLTALLSLLSPSAQGMQGEPEAPVSAEAAPEAEPAPTWRFRKADKPVKVVVLAGSIGAYRRNPYSKQLANLCTNIEVRNISKTGLGAWALKKRFQQQVLDNSYLRWNVEGEEYWLVFGGGLNSVGNPRSTNHQMRRLFELAHRRGMKVVAMSLTPWGDDRDKRWRGIGGLRSMRATRAVVDFTLGRLSPRQALGSFADKRRVDADADWQPNEIPDIAIDLYDSALRDRQAPLRDLVEMREAVAKDKTWQRAHADLDEFQRANALELDALAATEVPRWFMRPELRAFDHIHPNADGHQLMAETMCPELPQSWGCACPTAQPAEAPAEAPADEPVGP
ncbi:MAG: hypothetical protein K0V04_04730 [Deltaproteobacteria bacterium]|nr:hypothetical protein [Deltaproteobacteria bacterium]